MVSRKTEREVIMFDELRNLCITNNYFTCGSSRQYNRMFEMADNGAPVHDIALIIWVCSYDADMRKIEEQVAEIFAMHKIESDVLPSDVIE